VKSRRLEVVRGSGNVYRNLGHENALDRARLSVRQAQVRTGIAAPDFSRIRNADLGRFTLDRLMSIINRLGSRVEVRLKVRRVAARTSQQPEREELNALGSTDREGHRRVRLLTRQ